jgi:hypothetical protein
MPIKNFLTLQNSEVTYVNICVVGAFSNCNSVQELIITL